MSIYGYGQNKPWPDRCIESVHDGGRAVSFHQCTRKPVTTDGKYCRIHDPERIKAKNAAWEKAWSEKQVEEDNIEQEGKRLAKKLGVKTHIYFNSFVPVGRYERQLIISFEDIKKILTK